MKCKHCKRDGLPEHSIYCCWCGKKLVKMDDDIDIKPPTRKKDGTYTGRIMVNGIRKTINAPTEAKFYAAVRAYKSEIVELKAAPTRITLSDACDAYIKSRSEVLSPSTIYGYQRIQKSRFKDYMDKDIRSINYQQMINDEFKLCGAKTLKNAWGFAVSVLKSQSVEVPNVALPQVVSKELPWLDDKQIKAFIKAMDKAEAERTTPLVGNDYRIGALLALHGLRRSEVLGITPNKIVDDKILVEGSVVVSENGMVAKETNKNQTSRREVPIMIPKLKTLLLASKNEPEQPFVVNGNGLWKYIRDVCEDAKLPPCTPHSLRRTFVSLAYSIGWSELECQRIGGWNDYQTMHKIYIKLSSKDQSKAAKKMQKFYAK